MTARPFEDFTIVRHQLFGRSFVNVHHKESGVRGQLVVTRGLVTASGPEGTRYFRGGGGGEYMRARSWVCQTIRAWVAQRERDRLADDRMGLPEEPLGT